MHQNSKVTLSTVSEQDAETLVSIRIAAMRESLERIGRFNEKRARERFLSEFVPAETSYINFRGKRVGFVVVKVLKDELKLDHLYILPEFQGQGVGSAVLTMIFAQADARGSNIRVGALRESDSNRFYLQRNFKLVERAQWDNYYLRLPNPPS